MKHFDIYKPSKDFEIIVVGEIDSQFSPVKNIHNEIKMKGEPRIINLKTK